MRTKSSSGTCVNVSMDGKRGRWPRRTENTDRSISELPRAGLKLFLSSHIFDEVVLFAKAAVWSLSILFDFDRLFMRLSTSQVFPINQSGRPSVSTPNSVHCFSSIHSLKPNFPMPHSAELEHRAGNGNGGGGGGDGGGGGGGATAMSATVAFHRTRLGAPSRLETIDSLE